MLIDTHAHLNHDQYSKDLDAVVCRAKDAGVGAIIVVGFDLASSRAAVALAEQFPECFAAVGIHPHEAGSFSQDALDELRGLTARTRVVAVGETGLDFHYDHSPRQAQRETFAALLRLATEARLPVIIHDREAHEDALAILRDVGIPERRGVFHCFSGDLGLADRCLELGFYIGITGVVTFKNAAETREVVRKVPLRRLLIETDCPYLAPAPHRGKRNEPAYVQHVAAEIARLKGKLSDEVAEITSKNAGRLFGLGGVGK